MSPEKAAEIVAKLETRINLAQVEADKCKKADQDAAFLEYQGEKHNRAETRKALVTAQNELENVSAALAAAKSRHADALAIVAQKEKLARWEQVRELGLERENLAVAIELESVEIIKKFNTLVDLSRRQFEAAPEKDQQFSHSQLGEATLVVSLRRIFSREGAAWAMRYNGRPEDLVTLEKITKDGNAWISKFAPPELKAYFTPLAELS